MKYAVSRITLDLQSTSDPTTLNAKQGDSAREIYCGFRDKDGPFPLTEDMQVIFTAEKPSGNRIYNECTVVGNFVSYRFTAQTVSEAGALKCEFKIYDKPDGLLKLTSPRFVVNVEEPVFNDGDIPESSYEFTAISDIIQKTVREYLTEHPTVTDKTLLIEDRPADAKAAGDEIRERLPKSGGTMTGDIAMGGNLVTGLGAPGEDTDAATKAYVDAKRMTAAATITTTWSGSAAPYTQDVSVEGLSLNDSPHITPKYATAVATALAQKEAWNMINEAIAYTGKITFRCFESKPTTAINIEIEVNR